MPQMRQLAAAVGQGAAGLPIGGAPAFDGDLDRLPAGAEGDGGQGGGRLEGLGMMEKGDGIKSKNTSGISELRADGVSQIERRIPLGGGLHSFARQFTAKERQGLAERQEESDGHICGDARGTPKSLARRLQ